MIYPATPTEAVLLRPGPSTLPSSSCASSCLREHSENHHVDTWTWVNQRASQWAKYFAPVSHFLLKRALEDSGLILALGREPLQAHDTTASDPIAGELGLGPWDSESGPHRDTRASTDMEVQAAWLPLVSPEGTPRGLAPPALPCGSTNPRVALPGHVPSWPCLGATFLLPQLFSLPSYLHHFLSGRLTPSYAWTPSNPRPRALGRAPRLTGM